MHCAPCIDRREARPWPLARPVGMRRPFAQVDVFGQTPLLGNPVAVVLDAEGIAEEQMRRFARWTNLSETTFVLPPTDPSADYRVRIFTPDEELSFAGHPTLGTCHAWLEVARAAGVTAPDAEVSQECGAGLVTIRLGPQGLAFQAPPLVRSGPVDEELLRRVASMLRIARGEVVDAQWVDNGPGWVAVLLRDAASVLALSPGALDLPVGAVGPHPAGAPEAFEVRAFLPGPTGTWEDPVTGSLNASLAQWLTGSGRAGSAYVASQGGALGRRGRVQIERDGDGRIWVGGRTETLVAGEVEL